MKANKLIYTEIKRRGSEPSLSAGKNYKTKKIPCKLILYGGFLFLVHSKNKHIFSLESSGAFIPSCPHCMYNGFIMNDLYDNGKKNALTYTLMPSLRFEVDFSHNMLAVSHIFFFIDSSCLV